ncbi:MAG TPA: hypothetical protein DDZ39_05170 [Flavobacteriaceae bacterium]|jgi:hypothetical protein|nr:hypothetical protein [Flavobacteriaceae bacterium]HBS12349.1 hypothetical protein [Flavobacteriaceae bacterium]
MTFSIVENIRNHNEWDSVKGIFIGIFKFLILIILIPILLISGLIGFFKKEKEIAKVNEWTGFYSNENFKLNRIFIDENELPEFLDYPEECNDIYLFKVKSEPKISELEDKFIDYQFVTDENGIYLMSFNPENEGMTIWYIDNQKQKLEKVKDIQSSWWNFGKREGKIILETTLNRKDIKLEIKKGYNKELC